MSCEILKGSPGLIHRVYHDLESYYWVILWIVLRHTRHTLGQEMSEEVFEYSDIGRAVKKKSWWLIVQGNFLDEQPLIIEGNAPLTELMSKFKSLVAKMVVANYKNNHLTYEAVLEVFDDALAQTGWPEEDRVQCNLLDPRSKQDSAEGLRKPAPAIRRVAVSDSSLLKKRSGTNAELDVPSSIPEESTGAEAGPSTVPEDRRSSKRLKSKSHAEAMGPPPSPRSLLGELPPVEPAAAAVSKVSKGSRKKSRRSRQS